MLLAPQAPRRAYRCLSILVLGAILVSGQSGRVPSSGLCNLDSIPAAVKSRLAMDFGSWKIQEDRSITAFTRGRWAAEKPLRCPGIAIGKFEKDRTQNYAFLLVPKAPTPRGYRFVLFSRKISASNYDLEILEQSDNAKPGSYFIRSVKVADFFDERSMKQFQPETGDCILMIDAAEDEYGAELFYRANGRYRSDFIDY